MKYLYSSILILLFSIFSFANNIGFEKNIGQIINQNNIQNTSILYSLKLNGFNVNLNKVGFNYDFYENENNIIKTHRIEFKFKNFNPKFKIIQSNQIDYVENYINKKDFIINFYQKIIYKNFYPNIDLEFYVNKNHKKPFEYNFVLYPGANINDIQFNIKGAKEKLKANQLEIKLRFGELVETLPKSWIENNHSKKDINIEYCYHQNGSIGLQSNENINNKKVIIDPLPIRKWGTHLNNDTGDFMHIYDVKFHKNNFVIIGATNQKKLGTEGVYQQNLTASRQLFIAKFNTESEKIWLTYFGSQDAELARKIDLDNDGNVYFAFTTSRNNLASNDSYQPFIKGMNEMIIVKLNDLGKRVWSTYYGGTDNEEAVDVAIDKINNNLYVAGLSYSDNLLKNEKNQFPLKSPREKRGLLVKFNLNGELIWSIYTHGDVQNISIDNDQNVIISEININKHNNSNKFLNSSGSSILTKIKPTSEIIWTRKFLGSMNTENEYNSEINDIAIDNLNNIIIGGSTNLTAGVSTLNSYNSNFTFNNYTEANWAGFIQKYNSSGEIIFGTYIGVKGQSFVNSLSINKNNDIYVGGNSSDPKQIIDNKGIMFSENHFMSNLRDLQEINSNGLAMLMKFNPNGSPIWGFMYGDFSYRSRFYGIDYDPLNNYIIAVGENKSPIMIGTPNSNQPEPAYIKNLANDSSSIVLFEDIPNNFKIDSNNECELQDLIYTATGADKYEWTDIKGNKFSDTAKFNPPYYGEFICKLEKENKIGYITIIVYDKRPPIIKPITKFLCDINAIGELDFDLSNLKNDFTFNPKLSVKYYLDVDYKNEISGKIRVFNGQKIYAKVLSEHGCYFNTSATFKLTDINIIQTQIETCIEENKLSEYDLLAKSFEIANTYMINGTKIKYYEKLEDAKLHNEKSIKTDTYVNTKKLDKIYAYYDNGEVCMTIFEISLIEKLVPTIQIEEINYTCENTITEVSINDNYDRIVWSNGKQGIRTSFNKPGKYSVTVYKNDCSLTKQFEIRNFNKLIFNYKYNGEFAIFNFNYQNVEISIDGINYSSSKTVKLTPGYYDFYFRYTLNNFTCEEKATIYLYKDLPNVITPNGDGINDFLDLSYIKELNYISVFDRFGKIIFQADKEKQPIKWDGKYQLRHLPSDNYWYIIDLENGKKIQGSILIKNK